MNKSSPRAFVTAALKGACLKIETHQSLVCLPRSLTRGASHSARLGVFRRRLLSSAHPPAFNDFFNKFHVNRLRRITSSQPRPVINGGVCVYVAAFYIDSRVSRVRGKNYAARAVTSACAIYWHIWYAALRQCETSNSRGRLRVIVSLYCTSFIIGAVNSIWGIKWPISFTCQTRKSANVCETIFSLHVLLFENNNPRVPTFWNMIPPFIICFSHACSIIKSTGRHNSTVFHR